MGMLAFYAGLIMGALGGIVGMALLSMLIMEDDQSLEPSDRAEGFLTLPPERAAIDT